MNMYMYYESLEEINLKIVLQVERHRKHLLCLADVSYDNKLLSINGNITYNY